jgi:hypothetical protein
MKFSPIRDISSGVLGAALGGFGLAGTAAKKFFIAQDDSFTKKFLVGLGVTVLTGGAALFPYLLAKAGQETKAEIAQTRQNVVNDRY